MQPVVVAGEPSSPRPPQSEITKAKCGIARHLYNHPTEVYPAALLARNVADGDRSLLVGACEWAIAELLKSDCLRLVPDPSRFPWAKYRSEVSGPVFVPESTHQPEPERAAKLFEEWNNQRVRATDHLWEAWPTWTAWSEGGTVKEESPQGFGLGELILQLESSERAFEANMRAAEEETSERAAYGARLQARALQFEPDPATMPGIHRIIVLCDERFGGTGLNAANVRKLRAALCRSHHLTMEQADALTLECAADALEGLERVPFADFQPMLQQQATSHPDFPLDTIEGLNLPIARSDVRIVQGAEPSVCPHADPPLPEEYLPLVDGALRRWPSVVSMREGSSVHWIGRNAWRKNLCKCNPSTEIKLPPSTTGDREQSEGEPLPAAQRGEQIKQLESSVRLAYLAFCYAELKAGNKLEDREAYVLLREEGFSADAGELAEYDLPNSFETWSRYLRDARKVLGESKYTRRSGRPRGKSIVKGDEVEYQKKKKGEDE